MGQKFNAATARPKYGGEGVWWHNVGQAHMNDKGQIMVYLDSVPVPDLKKEGKICFVLFPKEDTGSGDREQSSDRSSTSRGKPAARSSRKDDIDDEIPF